MGRNRPSPEELLCRVEAEERSARRGKLKIFLGYASGVGKSIRMLDEGRRRKARGEDVVVAAVQDESSPQAEELLQGLDVIPCRQVDRQMAIDVNAIRRRRPMVCLIDGLASKNPPGSKNHERWQDVEDLLSSGISVITTINLQYIREYQSRVEAIRGKKVQDSVPESFVRIADDIELVDAPAESCDGPDAMRSATDGRRQWQLSALREMALVLAADVVDHQLEEYLRRQGIAQSYGAHEKILVCITPRSNASLMIRRGKRQSDRFHGDLYVAYVEQEHLNAQDREMLQRNLGEARNVQAQVEILRGADPVDAILTFAEKCGITQIFVGHSQRRGWVDYLRPNPVERLILEADGIDIRVFPHAQSPS